MFAGVGKLFSSVKSYYNEINSATLTGAIDIVVVEQPDGTYQSSPFHVRFGKLGVIRSREKVVSFHRLGNTIPVFMTVACLDVCAEFVLSNSRYTIQCFDCKIKRFIIYGSRD